MDTDDHFLGSDIIIKLDSNLDFEDVVILIRNMANFLVKIMENVTDTINYVNVDPILKHIEQTKPIFEFHSDTYDIPESCIHLASSPSCANQAFRYGENVYGFQFHLEVDAALVERWLSAPVYQAEIAQTNGRIDPAVIRTDTEKNIDQLYDLSKNIFGSFLDLLGKVNRVTLIGSK